MEKLVPEDLTFAEVGHLPIIKDFAKKIELVDALGVGCRGGLHHGISGNLELVVLDIGQYLLGAAADLVRHPCELGDVNTVGVVRRAFDDAVEKEDRTTPLLDRHRSIHQARQHPPELGELVVVGGKEHESRVVFSVVEVFDDRPRE